MVSESRVFEKLFPNDSLGCSVPSSTDAGQWSPLLLSIWVIIDFMGISMMVIMPAVRKEDVAAILIAFDLMVMLDLKSWQCLYKL